MNKLFKLFDAKKPAHPKTDYDIGYNNGLTMAQAILLNNECINCQYHEPCDVRNRVWCRQMGRYMKEDGFCSEGVNDNG